MLTYQNKIFIKEDVSSDQIKSMFVNWILGSKHYNCNDLRLSNTPFHYKNKKGDVKLEIKEHTEQKFQLTACMFSNLDSNGEWTVYALCYKNIDAPNYIIIQQEFKPANTINIFPTIHRPYIVKQIADNGWIDDSQYLLFNQKNYCATDKHFFTIGYSDLDLLTELINGTKQNSLPLVYISNPITQKEFLHDNYIEKLAIDLIGTAYVVKEPNDTILIDKLSVKTKTRKAFRGFIGIYFQNQYFILNTKTRLYKNTSASREKLRNTICQAVWQLCASHESQDTTWKKLVDADAGKEILKEGYATLAAFQNEKKQKESAIKFYELLNKSKQFFEFPKFNGETSAQEKEKIRNTVLEAIKLGAERKYLSDSIGMEIASAVLEMNAPTNFTSNSIVNLSERTLKLDDFDIVFELESNKIIEERKKVQKELFALQAQLCYYEDNRNPICNYMLSRPNIKEDYTGEFNDTILSCLQKILDDDLFDEEKQTIIRKVLNKNHFTKDGKLRMQKIDEIISKKDRIDSHAIEILKKCGFIFTSEKEHKKAYYRDEKYSVIFASTPSDYRSNENSATDILKQISVY